MRIQGILATVGVALVLSGCAPSSGRVPDLELAEFPEPVAVAPGSTLAFGDAAWVEQSSNGTGYLLGVAVLDIVEGEPWIWKEFSNGDELLGYTPYFVIVQRQWLDADEKYDVSLYPVLSDGSAGFLMETEAEGAVSPATCEEFNIGLPRLDDPFQRLDCLLTAAPVGQRVTSVVYDGTFAREGGDLDPTAYLDAPVSWTAG